MLNQKKPSKGLSDAEIRLKNKLRNQNIKRALVISLSLIIASIFATALCMHVIQSLGTKINFELSGLSQVSTIAIEVTGVVLALLFAVLTSVSNQSRENRFAGIQLVNSSINELELLISQIETQSFEIESNNIIPALSVDSFIGQKLYARRYWIEDLSRVMTRLRAININWVAWKVDNTLEEELLNFASFGKSITNGFGDHSRKSLSAFKQAIRGAIIGLRRMDEANVGDRLLYLLSPVLGTLVVMMIVGFGFRIASDLDIGLNNSSKDILSYSIFISWYVVFQLFLLIILVAQWADDVRLRDIIWQNSSVQ